jgi:hypothetical protein
VQYKAEAVKVISSQDSIIKRQDSLINSLRRSNERLTKSVLPNLNEQIASLKREQIASEALFDTELKEEQAKIKALRRKRLGLSLYAGGGYSGTSTAIAPSVGIAITYTFLRF